MERTGRQFLPWLLMAAVIAIQTMLPSQAFAQAWPQRAVKFICPLGPGSGADITARLLAERLQS